MSGIYCLPPKQIFTVTVFKDGEGNTSSRLKVESDVCAPHDTYVVARHLQEAVYALRKSSSCGAQGAFLASITFYECGAEVYLCHNNIENTASIPSEKALKKTLKDFRCQFVDAVNGHYQSQEP